MNSWLARLLPGREPATPLSADARQTLADWQALEEADLGLPHFETRYVVVNTEASGLDLDKDRLLAVGALAISEESIRPQASYHALLGDDPVGALLGLLRFVGKSPLVMFNAEFNQALLGRALETHLGIDLDRPTLDLQWLLPILHPERNQDYQRLGHWMKSFDIETFQRHHALGDGHAIAQLLLTVLPAATVHGETCPRQLIELERARRRLRRAP